MELRQCISVGARVIDVQDWKANTKLQGYAPSDPVVLWFWEVVDSMNQADRASLLHFATGASCVPPGGFGRLQVPERLPIFLGALTNIFEQ